MSYLNLSRRFVGMGISCMAAPTGKDLATLTSKLRI